MTYAQFASLIRFYTHTDTTTFSDTDILLLANALKDEMAVKILAANENYFGAPLLTALVAGQREYALDSTVAGQFKFVEAKLDGTNWKRIYERDFNMDDFPIQESDILNAYAGRPAEFSIFRNSLWILSDAAIIDVANGLKIWAYIWPENFTDLTLTTEMAAAPSAGKHGWPRQFQELLAREVIVAYKESRDKPIALTQTEQARKSDFADMLDGISHPNLDRSIKGEFPSDDGSQY